MRGAIWDTTEEFGDAGLERCRAFMPVLGPLQTIQRAELLIISIGCWIMDPWLNLLLLVKDGDLMAIIQRMIHARGLSGYG